MIAISHGSGGGPWVHTALAQALVDAGFTVVLPLHKGDNWTDTGQRGPESWQQRPAEVSRAIDRVAADPRFAALRLDCVGAFGMSAGGHTVLSLAGGAWSPERFRAHCRQRLAEGLQACVGLATQLTGGLLDGPKLLAGPAAAGLEVRRRRRARTHADPRIAAIVAGVPLVADFDPATLARPRVPVGFLTARRDRWLLPRFHSDAVLAACAGASCWPTCQQAAMGAAGASAGSGRAGAA